MRLTQWTDYSLRVLMHCAAHEGRAQPTTISEVAEAHGISRSHLTKIVMTLAAQGFTTVQSYQLVPDEIADLRAGPNQRLPGRHTAKHGQRQAQRAPRGVATDQANRALLRHPVEATGEGRQPEGHH